VARHFEAVAGAPAAASGGAKHALALAPLPACMSIPACQHCLPASVQKTLTRLLPSHLTTPACLDVCAVIDAWVSTIAWWSVGYAFAFGQCGESAFIGERASAA
jgi:hypothetical protein